MIAASIVLGIHLASVHREPGFNNANVGAYVQFESGLTAGVVENSYRRTSFYAGWTWETADKRFALTAGAITGYPSAKVSPLLVPSYRHDMGDGWSARISYLPKPPRYGASDAVHASIERRF